MIPNGEQLITITLTRQEWFDITGALGHDIFDGALNAEYEKIWGAMWAAKNLDPRA